MGSKLETGIGGLRAGARRWWSENRIARHSQRAWGRCIGATRWDSKVTGFYQRTSIPAYPRLEKHSISTTNRQFRCEKKASLGE